MGENSKIEWTHHTFNPWWGCVKLSPACSNCYAETLAKRTGHGVWGSSAPRRFFGEKQWNEPRKWNADAERAGERRRVFCSSMADLFERHPNAETDDEMREARMRLCRLIDETPWLDWLLLTKRPENIAEMIPAHWAAEYPPNVWLGVTVETQDYAWRITELMKYRRRVRILFLSVEPMLGPIDLEPFLQYEPYIDERYKMTFGHEEWRGIDWVIVGGESGAKAKPTHPDWVRKLRDDVEPSDAAFFFKQWGEWFPMVDRDKFDPDWRCDYRESSKRRVMNLAGGRGFHGDRVILFERTGKTAAGRMLDGREWNEVPA